MRLGGKYRAAAILSFDRRLSLQLSYWRDDNAALVCHMLLQVITVESPELPFT
jgi:hypothetical protein